ncbi:hypothetical protein ONZ45_g713 [Pleurotus djamor]|nr:hypothetical protein ONZ45_g713 [Pleurotus djamor]
MGYPPVDGQKKRRKGATRLSCAECSNYDATASYHVVRVSSEGVVLSAQTALSLQAKAIDLFLHPPKSSMKKSPTLRTDHEPHPLLNEELLKIKAPLQREVPTQRNGALDRTKEEENNPDVVDAFGSLHIGSEGRTKYYGQIASSYHFMQNEEDSDPEPDNHMLELENILPKDILDRASSFPINSYQSLAQDTSVHLLRYYLPPVEQAVALKNFYFSHAAMMYNPISADSFNTEILNEVYGSPEGSPSEDSLRSHRLSLMFIVLAIGTLMDTSIQSYSLEAEKYNQLARAALFRHSLFDDPTITAVQALFLMTYYLFLSDRQGNSSGARWAIMGIAVKLAQSIGLHRDSGRWGVDQKETQRRRELFWELYTYDSWQCMTFGRPPSFTLAHVDCKMPHINDTSDEQSYHAWKHRFSAECMSILHDQAFGAKTPTYATVLQLDRKFRAFPVPPILQVAGFGQSESRPGGYPETVTLILQRHIVLAIRESNLLYLHRSFFARAVSDHPKDPLGSPYSTSVLAAYRSAGSLVALMRNLHSQLKEPSERMWFLWTHMFSCAIVLGSIVTRCPSMSLAPSALSQLDSACELFAKAAPAFRAEKVLGIMLGLQAKAHASFDEHRRNGSSPTGRYPPSEPVSPAGDSDELDTLGGKTILVNKRDSLSMERSPTSLNPVVPLPLSPTAGAAMNPQALEYLHMMMLSGPSSAGPSTAAPNPYQDDDVSMYGMSSLSGPFHAEPASYQPSQANILQGASTHHHQTQPPSPVYHHQPSIITNLNGHNMSSNMGGMASQPRFPQYFPVYDYAPAMVEQPMNGFSPVLDNSAALLGQDAGVRRSSGSPDNGMQTTWNEFVGGFLN